MPRKKSEEFYKQHGFSPKCINSKYSAICLFCDKELHNTALSRLALHRQTCDKKRNGIELSVSIDSIVNANGEPKVKSNSEEDISIEVLEYTTEDYDIHFKNQAVINIDDNTERELEEADPVKNEVSNKTSDFVIAQDDHQLEIDATECSNYFDIVNENLELRNKPKQGSLAALKADKVRAQIRQFQSKTQFLKSETELLKLERTLALLKIKKLRLEISTLRGHN